MSAVSHQNTAVTCRNVSGDCPPLRCDESEAEFVEGQCCKQCPCKSFLLKISVTVYWWLCSLFLPHSFLWQQSPNLPLQQDQVRLSIMVVPLAIHARAFLPGAHSYQLCPSIHTGCLDFDGNFFLDGQWWHPTLPDHGVVTCVNCTCEVSY